MKTRLIEIINKQGRDVTGRYIFILGAHSDGQATYTIPEHGDCIFSSHLEYLEIIETQEKEEVENEKEI